MEYLERKKQNYFRSGSANIKDVFNMAQIKALLDLDKEYVCKCYFSYQEWYQYPLVCIKTLFWECKEGVDSIIKIESKDETYLGLGLDKMW